MHNQGTINPPKDGLRLDPTTGHWWHGNDRVVIVERQTPHGPSRRTRVVKAGTPDFDPDMPTLQKIGRRATNHKPKSRSGGVGIAEIRAYLEARHGYTGPITKRIRDAARAAIIHRSTVAEYSRDANGRVARSRRMR